MEKVTHENIVARSVTVVDENGNAKLLLQASLGRCGIQMMGKDGEPKLELQVAENGETTILISDSQDQPSITIGVSETGKGLSVLADNVNVASLGCDLSGLGPLSSSQGYLLIRNTENDEQTFFPELGGT